MTVEVSVDGRPWKIGIEPAERPGQFAVTVKGKRRVIDASWVDADTLSLLDGALVHEIRLARRENGAVGVEIGGWVYEAAVRRGWPGSFFRPRFEKGPGAISIRRRCRAGSCVSSWR
jgi:hypothetical protein